MQDIRQRYNIVASAGSLSLRPYSYLVRRSRWLLVAAGLLALVAPIVPDSIGEDGRLVLYVLSIFLALHGLYNILIKANIRYIFDASANSIFKSSLLSQYKKLMRLEDAVVFVSEESGGWHYALGARKSHFVTSYSISEEFGAGHESQQQSQAYEEHILEKIHAMIASLQPVEFPSRRF
jgi:hypothetical protein